MKLKTLLFSCLSVLLLISCSQGTGKERGTSGNETEESESGAGERVAVVTPEADEEEEFDQFVEQFSKDESFQLRRIKFPISVIIPDTGHVGMAPMKESIGKYDWEPLDLTYDSTFLTRPYDQYYQVVRYRNDTAVVEIRGLNNGIYADYYFTLIDRKWYLVTLYEASF
ncbi:MAG: DUF4348 domain-containing protein [Proteiniphilum sp.]|nr:DUF4348 domain-containing protein [Proteiniphilum sp.]